MPANSKDFIGRSSCWNLELHLAIQTGDADFRSEGELGEGNRDIAGEIVFLPFKDGVRLDGQNNIEVARRAASRPRLPLTYGAETRTSVDSRGNLEFDSGILLNPSFSVTGLARVLNRLSRATALWTGLGDGKKSATDGDLALPTAGRACGCFGASCSTRPVAGGTWNGTPDGDFFFAAMDGFHELDF